MPAHTLKEINNSGIVWEDGELLPWEEIKVVGKDSVIFGATDVRFHLTTWEEYYIKKADGKKICLASTDSDEIFTLKRFFANALHLFEEAQKHSHIIFEKGGSFQKPATLDPHKQIIFLKKMLSPEIQAQRIKARRNIRVAFKVILAIILLFVGINIVLFFSRNTLN